MGEAAAAFCHFPRRSTPQQRGPSGLPRPRSRDGGGGIGSDRSDKDDPVVKMGIHPSGDGGGGVWRGGGQNRPPSPTGGNSSPFLLGVRSENGWRHPRPRASQILTREVFRHSSSVDPPPLVTKRLPSRAAPCIPPSRRFISLDFSRPARPLRRDPPLFLVTALEFYSSLGAGHVMSRRRHGGEAPLSARHGWAKLGGIPFFRIDFGPSGQPPCTAEAPPFVKSDSAIR